MSKQLFLMIRRTEEKVELRIRVRGLGTKGKNLFHLNTEVQDEGGKLGDRSRVKKMAGPGNSFEG